MRINRGTQRILYQPESEIDKHALELLRCLWKSWSKQPGTPLVMVTWTTDLQGYPELNQNQIGIPSEPGFRALMVDSSDSGYDIEHLFQMNVNQ